MIVYPPSPSGRSCKRTVQWRHTNVQDGLVRTDPEMLSKLISTESLHKYYKLDPTPFAKGEFASVWRCKCIATGETYAAKFSNRYRYGEDCTLEIYHEIALLSLCSPSPRIIKLHDVFQTQKELIIVMEYAPGGDMQTLIDDNLVPFEKDVVKYVHDVVEALAYLHHRKIAHLDIKPQNLVMMGEFPDCEIKVCDFEISRVVLDGTEVHEILGTPEYVAPEILHYEPITLAADMWSLGVTTYVLLTGFSPFGGETDQETFLNISRAQVDFPEELFEDVSEDAKDFVKRLLRRNPKERMSSKLALKHPWLVKARKALQAGSKARPESRKGCASCPASNNSLRNYLSKSREALFEKVMSQGDLRKKTLIQQYNRTRRMCESQMSLCAREKLLRKESAMSRSREKLYGLKSLSKSQEVLSFYKSVLNLHDDIFKTTKDKKNALTAVVAEIEEDNLKPSQTTPSPSNLGEQKTMHQEVQKELTATTDLGDPESNNAHHAPSPTSTEAATTSESEISEEEDCDKDTETGNTTKSQSVTPEASEPKKPPAEPNDEDAEEEPKFTVAQLISAYNKHQELITKSSLEVTMQNQRFDNIAGEVFPTGPNALRLFIPDIKIRKSKPRHKKKVSRKKTGLPTEPLDLSEDMEDLEVNEPSSHGESPLMKIPDPEEIRNDNAVQETSNVLPTPLKDRLTPSPTPVPKTSRTAASPEPTLALIVQDKRLESPQLVNAEESKHLPTSNVAKTVELFNSLRPDRKSFSSSHSPVQTPASPEKTRRKSSPPTMKPF